MMRGAKHRLRIGVAPFSSSLPPLGGTGGIALHSNAAVVEHSQPSHSGGDAILGGRESPAIRLLEVGLNQVALQQHPTQHVLGQAVALLCGGQVQLGCARAISYNAPAVEITCCQVALSQWIATS